MPGPVVIFQEGPGGANDEAAAETRVQDVALVRVPPLEHVVDVGEAHDQRIGTEATRQMVHRTREI